MAVKRISNINIVNNKSFFTAIYGNVTGGEFFIDNDLKTYSLEQQLYLYLESEGYTVLFYQQAAQYNVYSYSREDVRTFLYDFEQNKPQSKKYIARHISSPFRQSRLNRRNNETDVVNNQPEDSAIQAYPHNEKSPDTIYRTSRDTFLREDLERIFINNNDRSKKIAFIISNAEKCNFNNDYTALFKSISDTYDKNNSRNKIFLLYNYLYSQSLIQAFDDLSKKSCFFFENTYKQLFVKDGKLNQSNTYFVSLPDKEEIVNLLNLERLSKGKQLDWKNFDNIVELFVAEGRTLTANRNIIDNISELSMAELLNNNVIKSKTITLDIDKVRPILDKIKGQQDNIEIIIKAITTWAKDKKRKKPATFFMVGSSGVGKTFTAETFAKALESSGFQYKEIKMTEYSSEDTKNNLVGSSEGFIGSDKTPKLFQDIRNNRRLVICFDEMEKAHSSIWKLLMQLVDKGELSNKDQQENFKECILFFTSNLAQNEVIEQKNNLLKSNYSENKIHLLTDTEFKQQIRDTLERNSGGVPPEVWGRMVNILIYNRLQEKDVIEIAIDNIRDFAAEKDIKINNISPEYLAYLANRHSNSRYGMRDLVDEIQQKISELIYE